MPDHYIYIYIYIYHHIIGIINYVKPFSKFYRRHSDLVSKFNVGLKSLLQQGLSEPEFYGDIYIYIYIAHEDIYIYIYILLTKRIYSVQCILSCSAAGLELVYLISSEINTPGNYGVYISQLI